MQQLRTYVVSLTATATLCGVVLSLFPEGVIQKLLRLVCGIVLTIAVLSPLSDITLCEFSFVPENHLIAGENIAAMGNALAGEEKHRRIQQQFEAYILTKASALDAAVIPMVTLDNQGFPAEVQIKGTWSFSGKQALSAIITNDLGILEEDQIWTEQT